MISKLASTTAIATALIAFPATVASAQDQQQGAQQQQQQQVAEACVEDMNAFAQRMNEDEFWFAGWGAGGYGTQPGADGTAATDGAAAPQGQPGMTRGLAGTMDPRTQAGMTDMPRNQIRTLYGAAHVLAQRGDSDGCEYIVAKMDEIYGEYGQQLQEAGVDPATVTTWRQEQLALSQPLAENEGMSSYRIDNITGTDVRNPQDENLGSVSDVIIDPSSGEANYILVARGGFLGMGQDHYAIPWSEVRATPGLETIVIEWTEAQLEQAPAVDPDRFRNPETMMDERRTTDEFWSQRG